MITSTDDGFIVTVTITVGSDVEIVLDDDFVNYVEEELEQEVNEDVIIKDVSNVEEFEDREDLVVYIVIGGCLCFVFTIAVSALICFKSKYAKKGQNNVQRMFSESNGENAFSSSHDNAVGNKSKAKQDQMTNAIGHGMDIDEFEVIGDDDTKGRDMNEEQKSDIQNEDVMTPNLNEALEMVKLVEHQQKRNVNEMTPNLDDALKMVNVSEGINEGKGNETIATRDENIDTKDEIKQDDDGGRVHYFMLDEVNDDPIVDDDEYGVTANAKEYLDWDHEDILQWIMGLENGLFVQYKDMLSVALKEDGINGHNLQQVDKGDIRGWGIKTFEHRQKLFVHIEFLTKKEGV